MCKADKAPFLFYFLRLFPPFSFFLAHWLRNFARHIPQNVCRVTDLLFSSILLLLSLSFRLETTLFIVSHCTNALCAKPSICLKFCVYREETQQLSNCWPSDAKHE